jgi:hypothetical protein
VFVALDTKETVKELYCVSVGGIKVVVTVVATGVAR